DPVDGLKQRLEKERARVVAIIGAVDSGGEEMRRSLYEAEAKNIETAWPEGAEDRKKLYETWKSQSAAVQAAIARFATAVADADKNVDEAQVKLEAAIEAEKTALRESVLAKKKMSDEVSDIRNKQEEVLDKRSKVSRDIQAQRDVVSQGKVVYAD